MRRFQNLTSLALVVTSMTGCIFKKNASEVQGTSDQTQTQTQQQQNQNQQPQTPVKECPAIKILTTTDDLGIWQMPHSEQDPSVKMANDNGIDMAYVTVAVIKRPNDAPTVYFANEKMPTSLTTDQQKIEWVLKTQKGQLNVAAKRGLQECSTVSALYDVNGSTEVGCFDADECRIIWAGGHQTGCEISAGKGLFNEEKLINCGELHRKDNSKTPM